MTLDRALSDFTVELEVYSGPYEWLLALILKEELEIFEVPLRELVSLYVQARDPAILQRLHRERFVLIEALNGFGVNLYQQLGQFGIGRGETLLV